MSGAMRYVKQIAGMMTALSLSGAVAVALFLCDDPVGVSDGLRWLRKDKEDESRLSAIPILLYHNIDGKGPFSITRDVLEEHFRMIRERGVRVITVHEMLSRLGRRTRYDAPSLAITFDDGYPAMYTKLLPLTKRYGYPVTLFVYLNAVAPNGSKRLTWNALRIMDASGIDIQCHSIRHEDLSVLSKKNDENSKRRLYEELYLSRRVMELYLNKKIDLFAFPYGRYDVQLLELARHAGYRRVFSTDYGSNVITRDNYCLRRQHIKNTYALTRLESIIK